MARKIIFTATSDISTDQRMQRICTALSKDYDVLLVGRIKKRSIGLPKYAFRTKRLNCFFFNGKLFYLEYNLRLLMFLMFNKFDTVCAVDLDTIAPCVLSGKLKGKNIIFDSHEYFEEVPEVANRNLVKKTWHSIGLFFIPKVDLAYTVNQSLADIFSQIYHKKFEIVENRPILKPLVVKENEVNNKTILIYQGVLNQGRGLEVAIESMNKIDALLWIVGDGDIIDKLIGLVEKFNLQDKVIFYGQKSPNELVQISKKADIGLNLLEDKGKSYYYSLANKFFDYVQSGLPQITMNFPEYKRYNDIQEVAILMDELSVDNFIEAYNKVNSKNRQNKFDETLKVAKSKWIWKSQETKLLNLYKTLM